MSRIVTTKVEVFKFDELSENIQSSVISDHIEFYLDVFGEDMPETWKKEIDKCEEMRTPWFTIVSIYHADKENIDKELNKREYLIDGRIFAKNKIEV